MSELHHFGHHAGESNYHPDADQLSAFVERALPAHERQQVLAHLAICTGCRETVALSLPDMVLPQTERPARRPRFRSWTILVPASAALAASIFFAVSIHHTDTAANNNSVKRQQLIATSQPPTPVVHKQTLAPRAAATAENKSLSANRLAPAPQAAGAQGLPFEANAARQASPATPSIAAMSENRKTAPSAFGEAGVGAKLVQLPTAPQAAEASSPGANAPLFAGARQTVVIKNEAHALDTVSANLQLNAAPRVRDAGLAHPLPGGQAPLSVAASGSEIVAIDVHNVVYLSRDSGEHWTLVQVPWLGRAVKVNVTANLTVHGTSFAPVAGRISALSAIAPTASSASLTGIATDVTGAVVSNATITVHNEATDSERTVTTDAKGRYLVDDLATGSYTLDAQAPGFKSRHLTDIAVDASRQRVENLTLEVGSASQSVQVTADSQEAPGARPAKSKSSVAAVSTAPQAVFTIITDAGEQWTSADGLIWQRR